MKANRSLIPITVAAAVLALGITAIAGKPLAEVPVVSTIQGTGILADGTIPNYRWQSDQLGDDTNGVDGVVSRLQGGSFGTGAGDWELSAEGSSVRTLTIDLREPRDANASPPFPYALVNARYISKCHLVTPQSYLGMKGLNSTLICPMLLRFVWGGDVYRLIMDRNALADTNDILVTCTDVSGNAVDPNAPCSGWTMDPSVTDSGGARNVARLKREFKVKGQSYVEDRGGFYIRFHFSFHK